MAYPVHPMVVLVYDYRENTYGMQFWLAPPAEVNNKDLVIDRERGLWGMRNTSSPEMKLIPFGEYLPREYEKEAFPDANPQEKKKVFKVGERILMVIDLNNARSLQSLEGSVDLAHRNAVHHVGRMISEAKKTPSSVEPSLK